MIRYLDVGSAFTAHVGGSLIVLVSLFFIKVAPPEHRGRLNRNLLVDIAESFKYVAGHGAIWPLFLLLTVGSMMLRPVQDLLPGFADKVFHAGSEGLGWLASAIGIGAMISATWIAMRGRVTGLSGWAIAGGLVLVVATIGFTSTDQLWLGLVFAALCGFGLNTMSTSIQTITQSVVSDGMRGRVMSLYSLIFRGMPAIGALVLGAMADRVGLQLSFGIAAALSLMVWLPVALQHRVIADALNREPA
jgi:MFS family permease